MTRHHLLALVVLALLVGVIPSALAQQPPGGDDPETPGDGPSAATLDVAVGFGGRGVRAGSWVPVEVTVAADRLVAGTLTVGVQGGAQGSEVVDVEVQGGTAKVVRVVLPPGDRVTATLELPDGQQVVRHAGVAPAAGVLVGLLGETVPAAAPELTTAVTQQRTLLVPVPAGWLDRPVRALEALDALVVEDTALAALGDAARRQLAAAAVAGLDLVVTATRPGPVDLGLPWQAATEVRTAAAGPELVPAAGAWTVAADDGSEATAAAVPAGDGRLVVVAGELVGGDAGRWRQVLAPRGVIAGGTIRQQEVGHLTAEVLRTDDLDLPSLGWLAGFVVLYVLAVGPVNGLVLGRLRRRELAWVTVPAVTVVFVAVAFAASRGAQPPVALSATATAWSDGVGTELEAVLVRAPSGGVRVVSLPGRDWAVSGGQAGRPATVDRRGTATGVAMHLESLEVGTVTAWRPTSAAPPLEVTATATGEGLELTVRNRSGETVRDLIALVATHREPLGDELAPGESRTFSVRIGPELTIDGWFGDTAGGWRDGNGSLQAPRSLGALLAWDVLDRDPGTVWVAGTTEAASGADVEVEGGATQDAGTFLAVGVRAPAADGDVPAWAVDRDLLLSDLQAPPFQPNMLEQPSGVVRFRLPRAGAVTSLAPSLDGTGFGGREVPARPMPGPMPPPPGGTEPTVCLEDDPDGDGRTRTLCRPESGIPPMFPPCPPDALHCTYDHQSFEICHGDGVCEAGATAEPAPDIAMPMPPDEGRPTWELWDHVARSWVPAAAVVDDGVVAAPGAFVSPLGEVYARVTTPGFPLDLSGAGLGAGIGGGP